MLMGFLRPVPRVQQIEVVNQQQPKSSLLACPSAPTPTPKFPPRSSTAGAGARQAAHTPLGSSRMATTLTPTQRYAAGTLLALALRQAQIHQSEPLGSGPDDEERASSASGSSSSTISSTGSDTTSGAGLWTHDSRGLLRPVFRCRVANPAPVPASHSPAIRDFCACDVL